MTLDMADQDIREALQRKKDPVIEQPFPILIKSTVVRGQGRGDNELGIPTANLCPEVVEKTCDELKLGIYFGWSQVVTKPGVHPMVMSIGRNPFYGNNATSAEVHIIHRYSSDFYGEEVQVIVTGYLRPEKNYNGVDELIEDIKLDIQVAKLVLSRPSFQAQSQNAFFKLMASE